MRRAALVLVLTIGCGEGVETFPMGPDPLPDAAPETDTSTGERAPADLACTGTWVDGCADREVVPVALGILNPGDLNVAVTRGGHVGILWNTMFHADSGALALRRFDKETPAEFTMATFMDGDFTVVGRHHALATGSEERFHLAYWVGGSTRAVAYRAALVGQEPEDAVDVPWDASDDGLLAMGVTEGGTVGLSVFDRADLHHRVYLLEPGAAWRMGGTLSESFTATAAGVGRASVVGGKDGKIHVAHLRSISEWTAQPRYSWWNGTGWSDLRTLDNQVPDRMSGYSLDMTVLPDGRRAIAYFDAASVPGAAELRVAVWSGDDATVIHVVTGDLATGDGMERLAVSLAVDPWGLLHLAVVRPRADAADLEYWRQDPAEPSAWLVDTVATGVATGAEAALVDLAIDSAGQPHLVWFDGSTGDVLYGTRQDR